MLDGALQEKESDKISEYKIRSLSSWISESRVRNSFGYIQGHGRTCGRDGSALEADVYGRAKGKPDDHMPQAAAFSTIAPR